MTRLKALLNKSWLQHQIQCFMPECLLAHSDEEGVVIF